MSGSSPLHLFAATPAVAATATPARTGVAPDAIGTDFARVAADLAAALQMGGDAPTTRPVPVDPNAPMNPMLTAGGPSPLVQPGVPTTRHATPIEARLDARLVVPMETAAIDPALLALPTDAAALLPTLPQMSERDVVAVSPDDTLSQQMFALLSGLAPPTAPVESTPATDAADLLAGMRAPVLPAQALPIANAPPAATPDAGAGAIDLSSLLSELPAMPRANETAAVAAPIAAATAAQIALAASQDVEREDAGAIDGLESLPPGVPLAVHGSTRGPSAPSTVMPPVQMPTDLDAGFDDALGARVAWAAEQKLGHAEIRLNPEHLGRIDLKIQLDGTRVSAEFASANADVRQALEATLPKLREMLGQHGLQLGQADVGQRQQNAPQSQGQSALGFGGTGFGDEGASANVATSTPAPVLRNRGLLDEYA
ncbi:flagellar hook-length control protein FliK [Luteimonas fraxinea]|uniref:Flagellar hook-length control protein FliK n=1 Tax=Luteimonas fraxinea TaxID=2901869 RepID=A0ABS8U8B6_9GAMM|nr:flagellar hook-length control protein FliK [Luteimonas fraxinea]MCD9095559.1 flagellar hook-length control protein FliK [Luteimonas fraxinea]MCD9126200.1 flagellar hook-length control protein FliK [Luteimonas fraxinea]UHH11240.1 flagellar hook-length control protein FliK [Luteimonas fraxinea]